MTTLADIGEARIIERFKSMTAPATDVITGIGDDCAVVRPSPDSDIDLVLTSDAVIEGVHFATGTDPVEVGHKAMGRALSDLAAMAAEPLWGLLDLAAPPDMPADAAEGLFAAANRLATRHGLSIVGGDSSSTTSLSVHVFCVGRVPSGAAFLRSNAKPGDSLCVTGQLGGSINGKHLAIEPRVAQGIWLRTHSFASCAIDISDGLVRDLYRICSSSQTGATLQLRDLPISADARNSRDNRPPLDHALHDGEDYELLFSVPADIVPTLLTEWQSAFDIPLTVIGRVTENTGVIDGVNEDGSTVELNDLGYDQFKADNV